MTLRPANVLHWTPRSPSVYNSEVAGAEPLSTNVIACELIWHDGSRKTRLGVGSGQRTRVLHFAECITMGHSVCLLRRLWAFALRPCDAQALQPTNPAVAGVGHCFRLRS